MKSLLPRLKEVRERVRELGYWCPQISREHGGMGLSLVEYGLVSAVLGRCQLGHYAFNCQAPDAGNMEILIKHGTPEQKRAFLEPLLQGRIHSCFAMTEPERPGSNPTWMETSAVKDGQDYVINGRKWFTSSADGASFAIVMAVTDAEAGRYDRALRDRELALRCPPFGSKVKTAHDMGREYRVLSKLHKAYSPAPRPFFYCEDESVLGAPFYGMERVRGVILRKYLPPGLEIQPDTARRMSESFIDNLAVLHGLDFEGVGLGNLGKPEGYVARQITGWIKRYERSRTHELEE